MAKHSTAAKLIVLILAMLYVLAVLSQFSFQSYVAEVREAAEAKENLTKLDTRDAVDIVRVNEEAELPGVNMARQTVNEHERSEEEKRIKKAKADAKKRAKERLKKRLAEKDRLEKKEAAQIAKENTKKTNKAAQDAWNGRKISKSAGTIQGPSGRETYYNLNMSGVLSIMRSMGYSKEEYPYAVRSDGVKTLGGYVMVAANLKIRPKGTLIETSVGTGIVVDTGGFARRNPTQLDIATNW